jgi:glyoxylase-like metal-dependent hydrolase (beta-lactamase superfamily II)
MRQPLRHSFPLIAALLVASLSVTFARCAMAADEHELLQQYTESAVEMRLDRVSEHVYVVIGESGVATDNEGFISNAAVVITDEGIVVFDALGTPSLARKFIEAVREVSDKPFVRVIASHYHADHIYGLQVFRELGAQIWAPVGADEYLRAPYAQERLEERRFSLEPWVNDHTVLVNADRYLREDESFTLGGVEFYISLLGSAHSEADLAVYVATDRVLLSGDIIFEGRVPYVGNANTHNWLTTLEALETRNLAALVPGHGPLAQNPNAALSLTRRYIARLREVMGQAVEDLTGFDEAFASADWSEFEHLPAFEFAHRRNAYQVYLSIEAESLN